MNPEYLLVDTFNYRQETLCQCLINQRLNSNLNFDKNRFKHMGVLFDSLKIICGLDNESILKDSNLFEKIEELKNNDEIKYKVCFFNDVKYIGDISDGKFNGHGELYLSERIYYKGNFKDNLFHGKGQLFSNFCDIYNGNFFEGYVNGHGIVRWRNGNLYKGQFEENLIHGFGIYEYNNGSRYKGNFVKGNRSGKGKLTLNRNDESLIEISSEDWKLDILRGRGSIISKNKSYYYKGEIETFYQIRRPYFVTYFPHGRGILLNKDEKETYVGQFNHGYREGNGNEYYDNGTKKYNGKFLNDKYDGKGKLYNESGDIEYNGDFHFGMKHGNGWVYHNDGLELAQYKFGDKFGKSIVTDSQYLKSDTKYYYGNNIVSKKLKLKDSNLQDEKCPICYCDYKNNDLITDLPNCGHTFHSECLFKWLETNETCPMCRSDKLFEESCSNKRKFEEIVDDNEIIAI